MASFDVAANTIYLAKHGSHAYGTSTPESDLDVKGVAVAPREVVLGFLYHFEQQESPKPKGDAEKSETVDSVVYDLRKFCSLAADCNPNIIEVLFVAEEDLLSISEPGRLLRENRERFLSRKVRHTFSGYAFAQLKRIRTHRKWLLDPPTKKPERSDFGLGEVKITPDMLGAFDKLASGEEASVEIDPNVMQLVQSEKQYRTALQHWNQYLNWKATRNEKRAVLEAQFGYDTKHAMHLVRLLRMCREILLGKGVLVKRPDAKELLAIRRGEWSYDALISWAEKEHEDLKALGEISPLPESPDLPALNDLCVRIEEMFWKDPNAPKYKREFRRTV